MSLGFKRSIRVNLTYYKTEPVEKHPANRTQNPQLHTRPTICKPKLQVPHTATICITLELQMMGIMVPETC